jgi:hypothetical protein
VAYGVGSVGAGVRGRKEVSPIGGRFGAAVGTPAVYIRKRPGMLGTLSRMDGRTHSLATGRRKSRGSVQGAVVSRDSINQSNQSIYCYKTI